MNFNHNAAIDNLTAMPFEMPDDPADVLLSVRKNLAANMAEAIKDGGYDIPFGWLGDVAGLLQINLPADPHL